MKDLFSKCGINCGHCPSHTENLRTDEERQRCSDGWYRYLGFRLSPGKLRPCDGCQVPDDENPVRYFSCSRRKCAIFNHVETCAHCSAYPCEAFGPDLDREEIAARLGSPIPEEDYLTFIEPYESRRHLDEIRASLNSEDIQAMTLVSLRPRVAAFPGDLPLSEEESSAFRSLHRLLASVGTADAVSYAQRLELGKRRRHLLKILWAFGRFGECRDEGGPHLVLDSETYLAQKIHSNYPRVLDYLGTLGEYGVRCEHIPLAEEGWLTATKALRRQGWYMRMSIDEDAGGVPVLKALREYTARLDEAFGRGAFRRFSRVDIQVLAAD
jgi:hypothetical protein